MTAGRYGVDWSLGIFPRYESESDAWEVLVRAFAPDKPDDALVFMGTHAVMGLARTATGRGGLAILRDFITPGYKGHGTAEMVWRAFDWSKQNAADRRAALSNLEKLLRDLERAATAAGFGRPLMEDLMIEIAEVREELADMSAQRTAPYFSTFDWLRDFPAARAVARAVVGIRCAYPLRAMNPLDTLEKVAAARAAIARRASL